MKEGAFETVDEIYKIGGPYIRDDRRILLSLDENHEKTQRIAERAGRKDGDNAVAWIKRFGEGRVFYCSLGHHKHNYWDKRIENGVSVLAIGGKANITVAVADTKKAGKHKDCGVRTGSYRAVFRGHGFQRRRCYTVVEVNSVSEQA